MTPGTVALTIIFTIILLGSAIGFYSRRRRTMSLEQWTVGGREFGTLLIWLLMAGEVYTAFSFLGLSGWTYSRGGPTLYDLAAFAAAVGVAFLVPYIQLQLTGLGIIMKVASFDAIGRTPAMMIGVALLAGFVFSSGIRAVAWVSVLKDALMI